MKKGVAILHYSHSSLKGTSLKDKTSLTDRVTAIMAFRERDVTETLSVPKTCSIEGRGTYPRTKYTGALTTTRYNSKRAFIDRDREHRAEGPKVMSDEVPSPYGTLKDWHWEQT